MSVDAILEQVEALSADERSELLGRLFDRYADPAPADDPEPPPISDEYRAFIEDRVAKYRANPDKLVSWEEVKASARARAKR